MGVMKPHVRKGWQSPETKNGFSPPASRGSSALLTAWLWLLPFRTVKECVCYFNHPSLWWSVTAALESEHTPTDRSPAEPGVQVLPTGKPKLFGWDIKWGLRRKPCTLYNATDPGKESVNTIPAGDTFVSGADQRQPLAAGSFNSVISPLKPFPVIFHFLGATHRFEISGMATSEWTALKKLKPHTSPICALGGITGLGDWDHPLPFPSSQGCSGQLTCGHSAPCDRQAAEDSWVAPAPGHRALPAPIPEKRDSRPGEGGGGGAAVGRQSPVRRVEGKQARSACSFFPTSLKT